MEQIISAEIVDSYFHKLKENLLIDVAVRGVLAGIVALYLYDAGL